ncbi:MAG: hypothetical protein QOF60_2555 [Actinomycetota bacterium]|nr:hypothetical protein [Actinomycetota bacterium]
METLRHLIFVSDRWMHRTILGETGPFHRLGLPPENKVGQRPPPAVDLSAGGVDVFAEATLDVILPIREDRAQEVRTLIGGLDDGDLSRLCAPNPTPGSPPGQIPLQAALDVLIREEWLHHEFATRDLATLESRQPPRAGSN